MRAFLGAIGLFAGISAVAVLLAVTGEVAGESQTISEAATTSCDVGSEACETAGVVLMGQAAHRLSSSAADPLAVPPSVVPVLHPDHPYPDHP